MDTYAPTESSAPVTDHPLRMSGRGAFYSFSFDLGPGLDIARLADSLLRKNMAVLAASPSSDDVRIPKRGLELDRQQREAVGLLEFLRVLHSGSASWRKLFHFHRRLTLNMIWTRRWAILHYYTRRILWGQHSGAAKVNETPEWVLQGQQQLNVAAEGYARMMLNEHILAAVRLKLEQKLYLPGYWNKMEPFIRIEMNRAYYWDDSHEYEPIEISLMAHRSGICILTFATPIAAEFGLPQGYKYLQARTRQFKQVEISMPIVGKPHRHISSAISDYHLWQRTHSGLDWFCAQIPLHNTELEISLQNIFQIYMSAIERTANREYVGEWRCNTTLFQGMPRCSCKGAEAKDRHAIEFAQLMVRCRAPMPVQNEVRQDLLKNYLINSQEELWLSAGHAIHTLWHSDKIDYLRDIYSVVPIESALLQHRQLQAIDQRTVLTRVRDADLFSAQQQLATGLPEYGRNLITDINAPAVVAGLAEKLKTADLYERLNDRVKVLESIVSTRFTRRQSRRSFAISVIGVAIVVLLLLPRVDEFIQKLDTLAPTRSIGSALNHFFGTSDNTSVAIYMIAVIATIAFLMVSTIRIPLSRLWQRKSNFGFATRGGLEVNMEPALPGDFEQSSAEDATESGPFSDR